MRFNKRLVFPTLFVLACAQLGCGKSSGDETVRDSNASGPAQDGTSTSPGNPAGAPNGPSFEVLPQRKFDIMFVVDNSASMGPKQRRLAQAIGAFTDVFLSPGVNADLRVGVTGVDVPGREDYNGCKSRRNGSLLYASCLDRPETFVDPGRSMSLYNTACASVCDLDSTAIQTKEVTVPGDATLARRNWIEYADGKTNLVDPKVSLSKALACVLPLGIHGCGLESQLDAMRNGVGFGVETDKDKEPAGLASFGFLRKDASLAVLHITDELDCSMNQDHELFAQGKPRSFLEQTFGKESSAFWVEGQEFMSSANCMRAGVLCKNENNGAYTSCEPQDWDLKRQALEPAQAGAQAVLRPVRTYIQELEVLGREKAKNHPNADVFVGMIGGVDPTDFSFRYSTGHSGTVKERENFKNFGIGFGCSFSAQLLEEKDPGKPGETVPATTAEHFAIPQIRMRAVVDAVSTGPGQRYGSICADDWKAQMAAFARTITQGSLSAMCVPYPVKDVDQSAKGVQARCQVFQEGGSQDGQEIMECTREQGVYVKHRERRSFVPPQGARSCFVLAGDRDGMQSEDKSDDMSGACSGAGNLELRIYRGIEDSDPAPTKWRATCEKA